VIKWLRNIFHKKELYFADIKIAGMFKYASRTQCRNLSVFIYSDKFNVDTFFRDNFSYLKEFQNNAIQI
jgi:hypothetical protein